ncbi:MAG: hypothetical protein ACE5E3_04165, partial [Mariprofundus sp.]
MTLHKFTPLNRRAIALNNVLVQSCWWPDNIHLTKTYGEDIPLVKANDERLEAAFINLLSNAIQAMTPEGGEIKVS